MNDLLHSLNIALNKENKDFHLKRFHEKGRNNFYFYRTFLKKWKK